MPTALAYKSFLVQGQVVVIKLLSPRSISGPYKHWHNMLASLQVLRFEVTNLPTIAIMLSVEVMSIHCTKCSKP